MLSVQFYLWLHLAGIGLVLLAVGGLAASDPARYRALAITHGIGLLAALVAGFGLLARAGILWPLPGWVLAKIALWLALGGSVVLFKRRPGLAAPLWWATWGAFLLAAFLAIARPF